MKLTLTDLSDLQNETTAVNAINANNAAIEAAIENTLSRDGTTPNQMGASLDMNSNKILNLPSPNSADQPVRLQDLANYATGGSVVFNALPTGGAQGGVLIKNSTTNYDAVWGGNSLSFDKRSDVTTSRIPASITSIIINRYDTAYPIQPALYTRGSSGSGLALTDAGGNTWDLSSTSIVGGAYAYPEWFGAKRDNSTDDAPAIRSCMSYLKPLQPSTMFLASGTYLLGSSVSTPTILGAIIVYTGVSIVGQGDSSVLRLKNSFSPSLDYALFKQLTDTATDRVDNATYTNFKIDGNIANNNFNRYAPCFYSTHNSNLTFDNFYITNWVGSQGIALGVNAGLGGLGVTPTSTNPRIFNCRFLDNFNNTFLTDFSNIFIVATDFIVTNCWCTNTVSNTFGTAIEVHGIGFCSNNVVRNHNKAFNVGSYPDTDVVLDSNSAYNVYAFATIWETLGGANPDFATKCIVSNNICFTKDSSLNNAIDLLNTRGVLNSYVKICDNYFESLEAAGTASTNGIVFGGKVRDLEIYNNTAVNYAGPFFQTGVDPVNNTTTLKIDNNVITDCGRTNVAGARIGIAILTSNNYNVLSVCNNIIKNTSTIYMTTGISSGAGLTATTGRGRIFGNNIFNVTTPINWVGSGRIEGIYINYTPTLTSGTGTPTSASATGRYRILNDSMTLYLTSLVTTVGTAAGDMIWSLPAGITPVSVNCPMSGKESATGKTVSGFALASGTTATARFYDNTTIWANGNTTYITGEVQIA